jgi:rhodanese-related sulfurtransferase
MFFSKPIKTVSPREVKIGLEQDAICLIDVREPHEFAAASISGALSMPLSSFDPQMISAKPGKEIIIHCQSGMRSAQAVKICEKSGIAASNMAGGIMAWQQSGNAVKFGA